MAPRMGAALEAFCPLLSLCPLRPPERPPPLPVGWCSVRDAPFGRGEYCQSCVPHVTCFPSYVLIWFFLFHIPSMFFDLSFLPAVYLIAPHLFQFSSLLPSILKPWFSPCLMSVIICLLVLLKSMFALFPCLLAPCSPLRECDKLSQSRFFLFLLLSGGFYVKIKIMFKLIIVRSKSLLIAVFLMKDTCRPEKKEIIIIKN